MGSVSMSVCSHRRAGKEGISASRGDASLIDLLISQKKYKFIEFINKNNFFITFLGKFFFILLKDFASGHFNIFSYFFYSIILKQE
jgi:hypothetical protein